MLTVYGKDNCQACMSAAMLLEQQGIPYEYKNCSEDFEAFDFMVSEGRRSFPQIYKGDKLFVEGGYKGLLEYFTS